MRTIRPGAWVMALCVMALVVAIGWSGGAQADPPTPAQQCEAKKNAAAGKKAECLGKEWGKAAAGKTPNFARCEDKFTEAFARAEAQAGLGVCPTEGDTVAIEAQVDACMADVASALAGVPPPPCEGTKFPATGQTTSYTAGDDGDIQAGAPLSYTDNGDGTITDDNTKLTWAKKSDDGTNHDKDNTYTWAAAFTDHVDKLNNTCDGAGVAACATDADCGAGLCGLAGYQDWRVSNVKEVQSIVNYENVNPAVSPAFDTDCAAACTVLTCSCTAAFPYWSSTSYANGPDLAWLVDFFGGSVDAFHKSFFLRVRAVRGGL